MFRGLLTLLGIVAVVCVVGYILKPEYFAKILNTQSDQPVATKTEIIPVTLSKSGTSGKTYQIRAKSEASAKLVQDLIEEEGEGAPPRSSAYLEIINVGTQTKRYIKLSRSVTNLELRTQLLTRSAGTPNDKFELLSGANKSGPYQATLWIASEYPQIEFNLEAELPVK